MEKIEEGIEALNALCKNLQNEKSVLQEKQKLFEDEKKKVQETRLPLEKLVKLNVGGMMFMTSRDTLTRHKNNVLEAMFSGRYSNPTLDDGSYFIDRDPTHFRYILNYLRDDGDIYLPNNEGVLHELYKEARYYCLEGLIKRIEETKIGEDEEVDTDQGFVWARKGTDIVLLNEDKTAKLDSKKNRWFPVQAQKPLIESEKRLNHFEVRIDDICPTSDNGYGIVVGVAPDDMDLDSPNALPGYSGRDGVGYVAHTGTVFPTTRNPPSFPPYKAGDVIRVELSNENTISFFKNGEIVGILTHSEKRPLHPTVAIFKGQVTLLNGKRIL